MKKVNSNVNFSRWDNCSFEQIKEEKKTLVNYLEKIQKEHESLKENMKQLNNPLMNMITLKITDDMKPHKDNLEKTIKEINEYLFSRFEDKN